MIWLAESADVPAATDEFRTQLVGTGEQLLAALRFFAHDVERGQCRGGSGGRAGGGKNVRPGTIHQPLDQRPAAGDEPAHATQRLAERADADVDAVFHAKVLGHAPAVLAEHARGVGFVDHQHRLVTLGQFGQLGQAGPDRRPC